MSAPKTPPSAAQPQVYADAHPGISDVLRVTPVAAEADLPGFETRAGYAFEIVGPRGGVRAAVWLAGDLVSSLRVQLGETAGALDSLHQKSVEQGG